MKRPARFLRVLGAAGMLVSMLAVMVGPATAQQDAPGDPAMDTLFDSTERSFRAGNNAIYYPWVANDDDFGLGPADTGISIQNLEDRDSQIWIYRGDGDDTWTPVTTAYLSAFASKTFSAADLGLAEGDGAPFAVLAFNISPSTVLTALIETAVILSNPVADDIGEGDNDGGDATQVVVCVVNEHLTEGYGSPSPFTATMDFEYNEVFYEQGDQVPWTTQEELQEILNTVNQFNFEELIDPFGGINQDGDCLDRIGETGETGLIFDSVAIGGVAKTAVNGNSLPFTSSADTAVSGYNSVNGAEVDRFNEWYLPIVQTNCGPGGCWESMLRVANLSTDNSAVTVRFFPSQHNPAGLQDPFQLEALVNGGDTWHINLGDHVPDEWVGTAHILSDGWVFAMVDRYKPGYNMWLTNTGSAANFENEAQVPGENGRYALFAPHILVGYFGWNTGINVANLSDADNNVSIQYFNMIGNATEVLNERLPVYGMTYFYDSSGDGPSSGANRGVVGSAIIWSDFPVAVAVDATKYPGAGTGGALDLFQGTSYNATQNVYTWQAVPLTQKGNATDGMGATSGINIMNPNAEVAATNVYWVDQSGFNAANFGVSGVTIPGYANGFVYSLWQHNLPNGFYGAAQVVSNVPVAAVSANVDYQVDGDGSVIYNAFNPCGYYRTVDPAAEGSRQCFLGDPLEISGQSVTKTFVDEDGLPLSGVQFHIVGNNPAFPYQRHGVSGVDGSATFTNVPVGEYDLNVDVVPGGYNLPVNPADSFTLIEGQDWAETNVLTWGSGFHKTVCVAAALDVEDPEVRPCSDVNLRGVNVRIYEVIGQTADGGPVIDRIVFDEETDREGTVEGILGAGTYMLCMYDADGIVTTTNDEQVETYLPQEIIADPEFGIICGTYNPYEIFTIGSGETTVLENPVFVRRSTTDMLDLFVWRGFGTTGSQLEQQSRPPMAGMEICIEQEYRIGQNNPYQMDPMRCGVTNEFGQLSFDEVRNDEVLFYDFDINPNSHVLQQDEEKVYTGRVFVYVNSDSHHLHCAEGGEMTTYPNLEYLPCGPTPLEGELFYARYVPSWDVAQDGVGNDINPDNTLAGTYDLQIELRENQ